MTATLRGECMHLLHTIGSDDEAYDDLCYATINN